MKISALSLMARFAVLTALLLLFTPQKTLSEQVQPSPPDAQALFLQHCAKCHGDQGQGQSAVVTIAGPSLKAVHDRGLVMTRMEAGKSHMPSFAKVLSVSQMEALADYVTQKLAVIPLEGGDLGEGGELMRVNCSPCHKAAVRGGALAYTDVNAPNLADATPSLIAGAIRWGPGPMPCFTAKMLDDKQLASIVKYIKFVGAAPNPGGSPLQHYGPVAEGFVGWVIVFGLVVMTIWIERGGRG